MEAPRLTSADEPGAFFITEAPQGFIAGGELFDGNARPGSEGADARVHGVEHTGLGL